MTKLTQQEINTYKNDGLVIPDYRLGDEMLGELKGIVENIVSENPDIRPEDLNNIHLPKRATNGGSVIGSERLLEFAANPDILDMLEPLIGPDIIFWSSHLFCKPGGDGMAVPWHQDGHYWPIKPLAACTVWIAIDDSLPENGCMRYVPGTHKDGMLPHIVDDRPDAALSLALSPDVFDETDARDDALKAGRLSIHDAYLVHGSRANRSVTRRAGLTFRYMPATSHFDRDFKQKDVVQAGRPPFADVESRPIYLVRGKNQNPRNTMVTSIE